MYLFLICRNIDFFNNTNDINLVIIHIGKHFPLYILDCIHQIRLFNKELNLFLLVEKNIYDLINEKYKSYILSYNIKVIDISTFTKTQLHIDFINNNNLDGSTRDGLFLYSTERFFYLQELVELYNLKNIFHIEYDNLIYCNLNNIVSVINDKYNIAAIFDNDNQGIASLIYFKDNSKIIHFNTYIEKNIKLVNDEMSMLSLYKNDNPDYIQHLPIVTEKYLNNLSSNFMKYVTYFNKIFDARALGQYIGGIDPKNTNEINTEGYINPHALINVSSFDIKWENENNLLIPYACEVPIVNLHIHCKNLLKWSSDSISKYNIDNVITGERLVSLFKKYNCLYYPTHDIDHFFENEFNSINDPFILLTHNSDDEISEKYQLYLNNDKIIYWFAQNVNTKNKKLINVPIGIANSQWKHGNLEIFSKYTNPQEIKDNLCYFGFTVDTNASFRNEIKNIIENNTNFEFINNIEYEDYLKKLANSKYCICPRGNGIDTHRLWECLYLKVIPIVDRNIVTENFENLGLMIIDDWNIINEEYLNNNYNEYYKKLNIITLNFYENILNNLN